MESCTDSVVRAVILKFLQRSSLGVTKYGVTLDRTDLGAGDWIQHAQEELMDGILYLEKLKQTLASCGADDV
uniref:Uncharacterized protein n=1 Tax=viral metagenome TaxID=1070528 RepID=A0A6C0LNI9_9ZZZZ